MKIELRNVSYLYEDGTSALDDVSLSFDTPQRIAILGENGAGKSTLFKLLVGLIRPTRGEVLLGEAKAHYRGKPLREWRASVGYVFQDPDVQLMSTSVRQEVAYGALNLGLSMEEVLTRTDEALASTDTTNLVDRPVHALSYGQKKRVSIADTLVTDPKILLLDEPTAWLDPLHARQVSEVFDQLHAQDVNLLLATHDVEFAFRWADRVIILSEGSLLYDGSPKEAFCNKGLLDKAGLTTPLLVEVAQVLQQRGWDLPSSGIPRDVLAFSQWAEERPF